MSARSVSGIASLGIAVLAGLTALVAGGVVAVWCVDWYRISSFEGNSGYFVVFMALVSGIGGIVVGLIVARAVAAAPGMNGFKALVFALATVLAVAGGVAGAARLLADIPPEIDGEALHLLVELRWPVGQRPPAGAGTVRLGTLRGSRLRAEEVGPLFLDDARLEGTQWIVPGARGWPDEPNHQNDVAPLGLSPDQRTLAWFSPGNGYDQDPLIATMRLDSGTTATLPIDRPRMRYRTPVLDINGAWLAHHFEWVRGDDGADRLRARSDFVPLPHRGALSPPMSGDHQSYDLGPGGRPLQAAVVEILVRQLHGVPMAEEYATVNTPRVAIEGVPISVQYVEGDAMVRVHSSKSQPDVMGRVAAHLDGVLASGQLDALLAEDPR